MKYDVCPNDSGSWLPLFNIVIEVNGRFILKPALGPLQKKLYENEEYGRWRARYYYCPECGCLLRGSYTIDYLKQNIHLEPISSFKKWLKNKIIGKLKEMDLFYQIIVTDDDGVKYFYTPEEAFQALQPYFQAVNNKIKYK
jgi:hypothetical protein